MKAVLWVLIVLNIALFGYFKLSEPMHDGIQPGHEPIQPERLKVLSPEELAALPKKLPAAPDTVAAVMLEQAGCYEWGSFSSNTIALARAVLEKSGQNINVRVAAPQEASRYWVYIPPRKTVQEAQARVEELRAVGINDTFLVQEGRWRNAISLGLFREEASAQRLAEELRSWGVADVTSAMRNQEGRQFVIDIKDMSSSMADEIRKLKPDFPYSEMREVACQ